MPLASLCIPHFSLMALMMAFLLSWGAKISTISFSSCTLCPQKPVADSLPMLLLWRTVPPPAPAALAASITLPLNPRSTMAAIKVCWFSIIMCSPFLSCSACSTLCIMRSIRLVTPVKGMVKAIPLFTASKRSFVCKRLNISLPKDLGTMLTRMHLSTLPKPKVSMISLEAVPLAFMRYWRGRSFSKNSSAALSASFWLAMSISKR